MFPCMQTREATAETVELYVSLHTDTQKQKQKQLNYLFLCMQTHRNNTEGVEELHISFQKDTSIKSGNTETINFDIPMYANPIHKTRNQTVKRNVSLHSDTSINANDMETVKLFVLLPVHTKNSTADIQTVQVTRLYACRHKFKLESSVLNYLLQKLINCSEFSLFIRENKYCDCRRNSG